MRLAFVGAGAIAAVHARALQQLPGAEIVAWTSRTRESAARMAQEFGGDITDFGAMLGRKDVDAVLICTPTHLHAEQVTACLEAGRRVFCEKPLARTAAECARLQQLDGEHIFPGHVLRFFHAYRQAHNAILRGDIGRPRRVVCRRFNSLPSGSENWFLDPERSGGVLLDLLIHDLDWLLWNFGEPAAAAAEPDAKRDPQGMRYVRATLRWENGLEAHVEGSWLHPQFEHSFVVEGEEGRLVAEPDGAELRLERGEAVKQVPLKGLPDPYVLQMAHFQSWLQGDQPPAATVAEAAAAVALAERLLRQLQER